MHKYNAPKYVAFITYCLLPLLSITEEWNLGVCIYWTLMTGLQIVLIVRKKKVLSISSLDVTFFFLLLYLVIRNLSTDIFTIKDLLFYCYLGTLYLWGRTYGKNNRKWLIYTLIATGVVQSIIGYLQLIGILNSNHSSVSCSGTYYNPAILGCQLSLSLVAIGYTFLQIKETNRFTRSITILCGLLIIPIWILSESRTAWIATGIVLSWMVFNKMGIRLMNRFIWIGSVLLLLALPIYKFKEVSAQSRILIWKVCCEMIYDKPYIGHGIRAVERNYMHYLANYLDRSGSKKEQHLAAPNIHVFNESINILCSYGFIGFILCAALLIIFWRKETGNSILRYLVLTYLLLSLSSYPFLSVSLISFFVLMIGCSNGHNATMRLKRHKILEAAVIGGLILLQVSYLYHYKRLNTSINVFHCDKERKAYIKRHYYFFTREKELVAKYAKFLFMNREYDEAIPLLERMLSLRPGLEVLCDLGVCHQQLGNYTEAENYFIYASKMFPTFITPQYHLFKLYRCIGDKEREYEKATFILKMKLKKENRTTQKIREEIKRLTLDTINE